MCVVYNRGEILVYKRKLGSNSRTGVQLYYDIKNSELGSIKFIYEKKIRRFVRKIFYQNIIRNVYKSYV